MSTLSAHGFGSEAYNLDRQATAHKQAGNMDAAIECLQQRKRLMGIEFMETKLAKYLQQAGRLDDALKEIQWLVSNSTAWAKHVFGHQPSSVVQCQKAGMLMRIYKDAALLCKRAKKPALQEKFEARQLAAMERREALQERANADRKARMEKRMAATKAAI